MKLEDLTADDVQLFINSLIIGYQIPEPLNAKTIKNIHGVLHKALSVAVTQGCVPFNAAQGTVLPKVRKRLKFYMKVRNLIRSHWKKLRCIRSVTRTSTSILTVRQ